MELAQLVGCRLARVISAGKSMTKGWPEPESWLLSKVSQSEKGGDNPCDRHLS